MRTNTVGWVSLAFFASLTWGQVSPVDTNVDRVFSITRAETVQDFQEIATLIRLMSAIKDTSTDNVQRALTVRGTAAQIALAEWLFKEFDKPPAPASQDAVTHQYCAGTDDSVRVFYLTHAAAVQEFQELANLVRTATGIRQAFTYNAQRALAVRGTGDQMALAEWLVKELDPAASHDSSPQEYRVSSNDVLRIFRFAQAGTVQDFQEMSNAIRSMADIRQAFTYNAQRALALRGTPDQMALAAWLFTELDKPANRLDSASGEYHVPGAKGEIVQVFYLTSMATVPEFQNAASRIRTAQGIPRAFTYNARRALALRGTVGQIALAQSMVSDLNKR